MTPASNTGMANAPAGFREVLRSRTFLCVAHRGASAYAPENTLEAFELACAQGADVLELDVHLTHDDEVVVMHDARVNRTTDGRGAVRALTLAEIRTLDAGRWFGERWRGARVPTLAEALQRFAARALIDIEIKGGVAVGGFRGRVREEPEESTRLARRVLEVVEAAEAVNRVVVSSSGAKALSWVRQANPQVATQWGVLALNIARACAFAAAAGFDVISPEVYAATGANVTRAHDKGLAVHIYAGNSERVMARLIRLGVDAVKTDRPDRLRALLARLRRR